MGRDHELKICACNVQMDLVLIDAVRRTPIPNFLFDLNAFQFEFDA